MHDPLPPLDLSAIAGTDKEARGRVVVGLVDENAARPMLGVVARLAAPVLVDAGALPLASEIDAPLVVTPNADEAEHCRGLTDAVVVDKGSITTVAHGERRWRHESELPGLAMSGTGDVLAGAIAGLIARAGTTHRFEAACWGVAAHAAAAVACGGAGTGYLARELLPHLPAALAHLADRQGSGDG